MLASDDAAVGITGDPQSLGLHGQGGIGKSVLAAALALDVRVREHFPDGVFWVSLGEDADVVAGQRDLLARLGTPAEVRFVAEGRELLRAALADRRSLVVVDDVWSVAAAAAFGAAGPRCRILYTTRDLGVLERVGARVQRIDVLSEQDARKLLGALTGTPAQRLPAEAAEVIEATGGVALALALVGAAIGPGGRSWRAVRDDLRRGTGTFLQHPYASAFKAMQVALAALPKATLKLYRLLAVYPQDTRVPVAAVGRYWNGLLGDVDVGMQLRLLDERKLLRLRAGAVELHDLERDFLLLHTDEISVLHQSLLDAYRRLLPADGGWRALPLDEPYIYEHLLYHLRGAGDRGALVDAATDLGFLTKHVYRNGPSAVEQDLEAVAASPLGTDAIVWLKRFLGRFGHLLVGHESLEEVAVAMRSRVHDPPEPIAADTLASVLPVCYLQPMWELPRRRGRAGTCPRRPRDRDRRCGVLL